LLNILPYDKETKPMKNWFDKMVSTVKTAQAITPPTSNSGKPGFSGQSGNQGNAGKPAGNIPVAQPQQTTNPPGNQQERPNQQNRQPNQQQVAQPKGLPELYRQYPAIKELVEWLQSARKVAAYIPASEELLKNTLADDALKNLSQELKNQVVAEANKQAN